MLRWALSASRDTRIGMLYLAANLPSVQVLAIKRILRYIDKVDVSTRFISEVKTGVLLQELKSVGPNVFHFF